MKFVYVIIFMFTAIGCHAYDGSAGDAGVDVVDASGSQGCAP